MWLFSFGDSLQSGEFVSQCGVSDEFVKLSTDLKTEETNSGRFEGKFNVEL